MKKTKEFKMIQAVNTQVCLTKGGRQSTRSERKNYNLKFGDRKEGITLIALVITIIVILLLAGVSIAMISGNNGILGQSKNAIIQYDISKTKEGIKLDLMEKYDESGKYSNADVVEAVKKVTGNDVEIGEETVLSKKGNIVEIADLWVEDTGESNENILRDENMFEFDTTTGTILRVKEEYLIDYYVTQYETYLNCSGGWCKIEEGVDTLVIPNSINGVAVKKIQNFGVINVKNVIIEDGIEEIGNINDHSYLSELETINIPDSVTCIRAYAFQKCSSLTNITIPSSVIGDYAFSDCSGLTDITITSSVTSIGNSAFYGCTGLTSITIPSSVTSFGNSVFYGCSDLENIVVNEGNINYDSRNNCNAIIESSTNKLIGGCKNTNIPDTVTSIGDDAFIGCTGLTSIIIPSSVTSIGKYAFGNCSGLTSITIPPSVTSIEYRSFSGCSSLTDITIPSSVTSIGKCAFDDCSSLTDITIPSSVTSIGAYAFSDCSSLTDIKIPSSVTSFGNSVFYGCSGLETIVVNEGNINYDSRNNCNAIIESSTNKLIVGCKNTNIPDTVTSIGDDAFIGCTGLTSITIPSSVTSIGDNAFEYCNGLTDITISSSVTSIGAYAFEYCSGLTDITIPSSVTSIGKYAFGFCSGLTSINIPSSVTVIDSWAFYGWNDNQIINIEHASKPSGWDYSWNDVCNATIKWNVSM